MEMSQPTRCCVDSHGMESFGVHMQISISNASKSQITFDRFAIKVCEINQEMKLVIYQKKFHALLNS